MHSKNIQKIISYESTFFKHYNVCLTFTKRNLVVMIKLVQNNTKSSKTYPL
jgi:hypothetical protein